MSALISTVAGCVGIKEKEAKRFVKFLVVGAIGFVVDFGIFNLLVGPFVALLAEGTPLTIALSHYKLDNHQVAALGNTAAGTISFITAIVSNFSWNRYWTYPDSRSKSLRRQFVQFVLVSLAGIIIRVPLMAFTNPPFIRLAAMAHMLAPYATRLGGNMALALAVVVVMFWNFFVNRYWTYSDVG